MLRNASLLRSGLLRSSLMRSSALPLCGAAFAESHLSSAAMQQSYAPAAGDAQSADKAEVLRLNQALLDTVMRLDWPAVSLHGQPSS